jgi:hypothetical protein
MRRLIKGASVILIGGDHMNVFTGSDAWNREPVMTNIPFLLRVRRDL